MNNPDNIGQFRQGVVVTKKGIIGLRVGHVTGFTVIDHILYVYVQWAHSEKVPYAEKIDNLTVMGDWGPK